MEIDAQQQKKDAFGIRIPEVDSGTVSVYELSSASNSRSRLGCGVVFQIEHVKA